MNQDQKYKKFKISDELIENIIKLVDESNDSKIVNNFKNSHHADIAEVLEELNSDQATYIIKLLDSEKTSDVLMELDEDYEDTVPSEKGDLFIAINTCLDILESDSSTDSEKSFYLKLLIHFIGDLHQPMHIGRYEDRGGNRINVKWFGRNSNLHRVWDSDMINGYNMSYSELAKNLPSPEKLEIEFERDDLIDWVNEVHSYTRKIYNDVSVNDNLGYEYQYENFQTVRDLLLIGGLRLASVLNYLFD